MRRRGYIDKIRMLRQVDASPRIADVCSSTPRSLLSTLKVVCPDSASTYKSALRQLSTSLQVSSAIQLLAFILSASLLSPWSIAATATNTNNSLGWDTNSTGWDTVTGNAWNSINGPTNTAVFTNTSGSIQVLNPITIGGLTYSPAGTFSIWGSQDQFGSSFHVQRCQRRLRIDRFQRHCR